TRGYAYKPRYGICTWKGRCTCHSYSHRPANSRMSWPRFRSSSPVAPTEESAVSPAATPDRATDFLGLACSAAGVGSCAIANSHRATRGGPRHRVTTSRSEDAPRRLRPELVGVDDDVELADLLGREL